MELFNIMKEKGWHIKAQAQGGLLEQLEGSTAHQLEKILLNEDLKQVGQVCIPDTAAKSSAMLAGPLVLQVSSARDITQPEKGVGGDGHKRMMFLLLTDGRSICRCLEYKSVNDLSKAMAPGTKVQIKNAVVRLGIILLEPKSVQVLGGRVDDLAEAWEIERKFGSTRPKGAEEELAPSFKHFDPRRTGRHHKGPYEGLRAPLPGALSGVTSASANKPEKEEEEVIRQVNVAAGSAPVSSNQSAVKSKLLAEMKPDNYRRPFRGQPQQNDGEPSEPQEHGSRGRGGRGSRGGRHSRAREEPSNTLTLEEYEAQKKRGLSLSKKTVRSDEELARQLHQELNVSPSQPIRQEGTSAQNLLSSMFSYGEDSQADYDDQSWQGGRGGRGHVGAYEGRGGSGRGRGRRGGRPRGRGRGGGGARGRGRH